MRARHAVTGGGATARTQGTCGADVPGQLRRRQGLHRLPRPRTEAEQTPLSALRLGELCQEAGFPDGIFTVVTGRAGVAVRLVSSPGVDRVTFTGCAEVGRQLARAASAGPRKTVLRVGGRAPLAIFRDADISQAIAGAAQAGFFSYFQTCTTGAVLYAEKDVCPEVAAGVAEHVRRFTAGPALDPASQLGPLVSAEHLRRTQTYLAATGGGHPEGGGYFIEPTVLTGISPQAAQAGVDVTGRVLPVLPLTDLREIASPAMAGLRGGAAGIWSRDVSKARQAAAVVHADTMWVNSYRVYDTRLPFGEPQRAGWGPEILANYLDSQSIIIQTRKAR